MNPQLEDIVSIINGNDFAPDKNRVFTYIEFVKTFGYENNPNVFISYYKEYVTRWAALKKEEISVTDEEFIFSKLVEILKSITLDYSSYEEQDFIAHIDLNNKSHIKALSALYSRKIREITEFYRKKRNESVLIVNRNSIKGSKKSIQEIIYEKVFDFIFSNKNIVPSYKNIKRDLLVTVENYVDTYSEYFDIPRTYEFTDDTRRDMLTANMNDVDYRVYLEIELVVSELLYSGNVMLEEIPLIAQLGLDLSQSCVGDMLALKNSLMANTVINQVDLNEQIALKRKLFEKYLGCDLWYMYVDLQGNVTLDVLCKAKNPTGNLLNCGNPDTATIPSNQEELLSHIGLFFKPDKTSILKINAKDYTWTINRDELINDTVYIFPDPNKYGDIGNNKDYHYPLIMEYHLDWDIRNMSSGTSVDDPLMFITDQGWRSYYSKQDDVFKHTKNTEWEYSFTYLVNRGFLSDYQRDVWGNEFGVLKGCETSTVTRTYIDDMGNEVTEEVPKLTLIGHGYKNDMIFGVNEEKTAVPKIINGGYFENPLYQGKEIYEEIKDDEGNVIYTRNYWAYNGDENKVQPFNYDKRLVLNKNYMWSGITVHGIPQNKQNIEFSASLYDNNYINFGRFGDSEGIEYEDHFKVVPSNYAGIVDNDKIIIDVLQQFLSVNLLENPNKVDFEYEAIEATYEDLKKMKGDLYVKLVSDINKKPFKITRELFDPYKNDGRFEWFTDDYKVSSFSAFGDVMIFEDDDTFHFVPYSYDGSVITSNLGLRELLELKKENREFTKILFHESNRVFYILQLQKWNENINRYTSAKSNNFNIHDKFLLLPKIYKFDPKNYEITEIINPFDIVYTRDYEIEKLGKRTSWKEYLNKKNQIVSDDNDGQKLRDALKSGKYSNFSDFEVPLYDLNKVGEVMFGFNSALGTFLISFVLIDWNGTPYIYEYKFKISSLEDFEATLKTNVYTLKELEDGASEVGYMMYNSVLEGGDMKSYPDETLINKRIFMGWSDWDSEQVWENEANYNEEFEICACPTFGGYVFEEYYNFNKEFKICACPTFGAYEMKGFSYITQPFDICACPTFGSYALSGFYYDEKEFPICACPLYGTYEFDTNLNMIQSFD